MLGFEFEPLTVVVSATIQTLWQRKLGHKKRESWIHHKSGTYFIESWTSVRHLGSKWCSSKHMFSMLWQDKMLPFGEQVCSLRTTHRSWLHSVDQWFSSHNGFPFNSLLGAYTWILWCLQGGFVAPQEPLN